jgi:hypothetical protein
MKRKRRRNVLKRGPTLLARYMEAFGLDDMPLPETELAKFMVFLTKVHQVTPDSARAYVAQVDAMYKDMALTVPRGDKGRVSRPVLRETLKGLAEDVGYRKTRCRKFRMTARRTMKCLQMFLPEARTTRFAHRMMLKELDTDTVVWGFWLCVAYEGFGRLADFLHKDPKDLEKYPKTALRWEDIRWSIFDGTSYWKAPPICANLLVLCKQDRKNRIGRPGIDIPLPSTNTCLSAPEWAWTLYKRRSPKPTDFLFLLEDGRHVTRTMGSLFLKKLLLRTGYDLADLAHCSFRRGAAHDARHLGGRRPDEVADMADWKKPQVNTAQQRYTRASLPCIASWVVEQVHAARDLPSDAESEASDGEIPERS